MLPLTPRELERRREHSSDRTAMASGASLTPLAREVARQLEMRAGILPSITFLETLVWPENGLSGWGVLHTPHAPCGKHDMALAGTNFSILALYICRQLLSAHGALKLQV